MGFLVTFQSSSWRCVGGSCLPGTAPPPKALPGPGLAPRRPHPPVNTSPINTPIYRCHGGGREVKQRGLPSDSGSHKRDSSSEAYGVTELSAARQGGYQTRPSVPTPIASTAPSWATLAAESGRAEREGGEPGFSVHRFPDAPVFEPPACLPQVLTQSSTPVHSFLHSVGLVNCNVHTEKCAYHK